MEIEDSKSHSLRLISSLNSLNLAHTSLLSSFSTLSSSFASQSLTLQSLQLQQQDSLETIESLEMQLDEWRGLFDLEKSNCLSLSKEIESLEKAKGKYDREIRKKDARIKDLKGAQEKLKIAERKILEIEKIREFKDWTGQTEANSSEKAVMTEEEKKEDRRREERKEDRRPEEGKEERGNLKENKKDEKEEREIEVKKEEKMTPRYKEKQIVEREIREYVRREKEKMKGMEEEKEEREEEEEGKEDLEEIKDEEDEVREEVRGVDGSFVHHGMGIGIHDVNSLNRSSVLNKEFASRRTLKRNIHIKGSSGIKNLIKVAASRGK